MSRNKVLEVNVCFFILCIWPFWTLFLSICRVFFLCYKTDLGLWVLKFTVCACVCVYARTHTHVYLLIHWCEDQRTLLVQLLRLSCYSWFLRQDFPLAPEACISGWLDWLDSSPQVSACLPSSRLWFTCMYCHARPWHASWGSCLLSKCFANPHLPRPSRFPL